jgi:hypothetical protein
LQHWWMLTTVFSKHHITLLALRGVDTVVNTHCVLYYNCSVSLLGIQKKKLIESLNVWGGSQGSDLLSVDCYERKDSKWSKTFYGVTSLMITLQYPYITFWRLDDSHDIQYIGIIAAWSLAWITATKYYYLYSFTMHVAITYV